MALGFLPLDLFSIRTGRFSVDMLRYHRYYIWGWLRGRFNIYLLLKIRYRSLIN